MKQLFRNVIMASGLLAGLGQTARANTYQFSFDVFSSGSDIYACNAGVMSQVVGRAICYQENDDGTRSPVAPDQGCIEGKNCRNKVHCTSPGGGDTYVNALTAEKKDWTDHSDTGMRGVPTGVIRAGANQKSQIFADEEAFDHKIQNLVFELTTEVYNAKYFVDICFRAPQTTIKNADAGVYFNLITNAGSTNFKSIGDMPTDGSFRNVTIMSPADVKAYTNLAGVKVQSFIVCDTKGSGGMQNATNNSGVYQTSQNEANFTFPNAGEITPSGSTSDFYYPSYLSPLSGAAQDMINTGITDPRFCRVRYVFTETNALSGAPLFRDWTRKGARMCTYTTINDPPQETAK